MPRKMRTDKRRDGRMRVEELFIFSSFTTDQLAAHYGTIEDAEARYDFLVSSGQVRKPRSWSAILENVGLEVVTL